MAESVSFDMMRQTVRDSQALAKDLDCRVRLKHQSGFAFVVVICAVCTICVPCLFLLASDPYIQRQQA